MLQFIFIRFFLIDITYIITYIICGCFSENWEIEDKIIYFLFFLLVQKELKKDAVFIGISDCIGTTRKTSPKTAKLFSCTTEAFTRYALKQTNWKLRLSRFLAQRNATAFKRAAAS